MESVNDYAELWCASNFTFLRGASHPEELIERAHVLGYQALAITDECSVSGMARAHVEARELGLHLLVGAQFTVTGDIPFTLIVLACNQNGYGNLCEFITRLRRSSEKGSYIVTVKEIDPDSLVDCVVLLAPPKTATPTELVVAGEWLRGGFAGRSWLAVDFHVNLTPLD